MMTAGPTPAATDLVAHAARIAAAQLALRESMAKVSAELAAERAAAAAGGPVTT